MDENSPVRSQLMVGIGVLLAVAALIGGIVGLVAIKAADVAGLGETSTTSDETGPPLGLGTNTPPSESTSMPTTSAAPSTPTESQTPTTPTETTKTRKPPKRRNVIMLDASPDTADTYERVNLTGTYQRGEGATLQVQRQEGGAWVDFPTDASVSGGSYSTYIETGHTGPNRFRVIDTATGRTSNVVVVQIS